MSLDDRFNQPPNDPDHDDASSGDAPPPPPPPPPVWGAPTNDDAGWGVGQVPGYTEKPKRKNDDFDYGEGRTFAWHEAWIAAVTQPSVATFEALIRDPRASFRRAALWIGALSLGVYVLQFGLIGMLGLGTGDLETALGSSVALVLCAPVIAVLAIAFLAIGWGLQFLAAKLLGGKGTFEQQFYANSCYYAPLMVASLVGVVPCIGALVGLGLGLYQIVLSVIACKAVHGFDWGRAVVSTFWLVFLVCGCLFCGLLISGPALSNVFQNIVDTLITPTPVR